MDKEKTNFEKRKDAYQKELEQLQEKLQISLYAANVVFPNGEVFPVIKMTDLRPDEVTKAKEVVE